MMFLKRHTIANIACILLGCITPSAAAASDIDDLTMLLQEFLGAAHEQTAHQRFWADDLVYTSSDGTRFGKAEILAGFAESEPSDESPTVAYSAADVDIRVFGDAAIVAFKLVGTPSDGTDIREYFNTGTFMKREGTWQVVAWQATSIPRAALATD